MIRGLNDLSVNSIYNHNHVTNQSCVCIPKYTITELNNSYLALGRMRCWGMDLNEVGLAWPAGLMEPERFLLLEEKSILGATHRRPKKGQ